MARTLKKLANNTGKIKKPVVEQEKIAPKVEELKQAIIKPISVPKTVTPKVEETALVEELIEEPTDIAEVAKVEAPTEMPTEPTTPSVEDRLRQESKSTTDALVQALRQRISESKAQQEQLIAQAPQTYDPLRAESEVRKSQELRSALERASVRGDRGGIGRSEALATQTAGDNRLTDINLQQQNFIDQANSEIASLESQGRYEEAQIVAEQKAQLLQNLMTEQVRQEGIQKEDTALERQQYMDTIGRFAQDYTAEINRVTNDGDPSNDWQLPILQAAKQQKIETQNLDPLTGQPLPETMTTQETLALAMDKWDMGLPLNEAEANALGVQVGATKPVSVSTSSGLSSSAMATNARYKVTNGIPLSADEAALMGVEPGYVAPGATATDTDFVGEADTFLNPVTIDTISDSKKNTMEQLINNPNLYENNIEKLQAILDDQNITMEELEVYEDWRDSALADRPFE